MRALKRFVYRNWQQVHGVRRMELAVLSRYLELEGSKRILDVGSGKGAFAGKLARAGHDVFGVDPSTKAAGDGGGYGGPRGEGGRGAGGGVPVFAREGDRA